MKFYTALIITLTLLAVVLVAFGSDGLERELSYMVFTDKNNKEAGKLSWSKGELKFEGNADLGAHIFFEQTLKPIVDEYLKSKKCEPKI